MVLLLLESHQVQFFKMAMCFQPHRMVGEVDCLSYAATNECCFDAFVTLQWSHFKKTHFKKKMCVASPWSWKITSQKKNNLGMVERKKTSVSKSWILRVHSYNFQSVSDSMLRRTHPSIPHPFLRWDPHKIYERIDIKGAHKKGDNNHHFDWLKCLKVESYESDVFPVFVHAFCFGFVFVNGSMSNQETRSYLSSVFSQRWGEASVWLTWEHHGQMLLSKNTNFHQSTGIRFRN